MRKTTRYGDLHMPDVDVEADLVLRYLQHQGEWAWLETSIAASLVPSQARVLDVGAFLGTFSLGLCQQNDVGYVCAVEANPMVADILQRNLADLLDTSHDVVGAAVLPSGATTRQGHAITGNLGSLSFASQDESSNGNGSAPHGDDTRTESVEVTSVTTISDLFRQHGPFDLVKVDVEGMELPLLVDGTDELKETPLLWVECNDDVRSLDVARQLLEWGRDVGYVSWPADNPANRRSAANAIFPHVHEAALVAGVGDARLRPELEALGCRLVMVENVDDLRAAMWGTPRWVPDPWRSLDGGPLVAQAVHDVLGDSFDEYLLEAEDPSGNRDAEDPADHRLGGVRRLQRLAQVLTGVPGGSADDFDSALESVNGLIRSLVADLQRERLRADNAERLLAASLVADLRSIPGSDRDGERAVRS